MRKLIAILLILSLCALPIHAEETPLPNSESSEEILTASETKDAPENTEETAETTVPESTEETPSETEAAETEPEETETETEETETEDGRDTEDLSAETLTETVPGDALSTDAVLPASVETLDSICFETVPVLGVGQSYPLNVSASAEELTYTAGSGAEVTEDGVFTASLPGLYTVRAESAGGAYAETDIRVVEAPRKIYVTKSELCLCVGETLPFSARTDTGADHGLSFVPQNSKLVKLDAENGRITGAQAGITKLEITAYNGVRTTVSVKVCSAPAAIRLSGRTSARVGDTFTVTVSSANGGYAGGYTLTSDRPHIIRVNANGTLTALSGGQAVILATSFNNKRAHIAITVVDPAHDIKAPIPYKQLKIEPIPVLGVGQSYSIKADTSAGALCFTADGGASITEDGTFTANTPGTYTIRADAETGAFGTATVKVVEAPTSVTTNADVIRVCVGETIPYPESHTNTGADYGMYYLSANTRIAVCDRDTGAITGVAAGNTLVGAGISSSIYKATPIYVYNAPSSLYLSGRTTVGVGESFTITVTANSGAETDHYTLTSDNPLVLRVKSNGSLTAHSAGTAVITATAFNGTSASLTITVIEPPKSVQLNAVPVLAVGQDYTVSSQLSSELLTFTANNGATITADGVFTATTPGTYTVRATSYNGVYGETTVTVVKAPTSIITSATELHVCVGDSIPYPESHTDTGADYGIYYISGNTRIALCDRDTGVITGVAAGNTVVGAGVSSSVYKNIPLYVHNAPSALYLSGRTTVGMQETFSMEVTANSGSLPGHYTVTSDDSEIVRANEDGTLTAMTTGTAVIRATAFNGVQGTITITVLPAPTEVFGGDALTVIAGDSAQTSFTWTEGAYATLTYSSSDNGIVTVAADGTVTAVNEGTAVITATAQNGVSGTVIVTVPPCPTELRLTFDEEKLYAGGIFPSTLTLLPEGSQAVCTYESANPSLLTVSEDGTVSCRSSGDTSITVTAANGLQAIFPIHIYTWADTHDLPYVMGHRGALAYCKGNTAVSFRTAGEMGAEMVELDVRLSSDGQVVVSHDKWAYGSYGSKLEIRTHTLSQLRKYDRDLLTLPQALSIIKEYNMEVLIEFKESDILNQVYACVENADMLDMVYFGSFDYNLITYSLAKDSNVRTMYITPSDDVIRNILRNPGEYFMDTVSMAISSAVTQECIDLMHLYGFKVVVYSLNTVADVMHWAKMGIDGYTTNCPDVHPVAE